MQETSNCFYSPAKAVIIDIIMSDGLSNFCRNNEAQIKEHYPDAEVMDIETAIKKMEDAHKTKPIQISEEAFDEALNVLPPMKSVQANRAFTFMSPEMYSGNITAIYASIYDPISNIKKHWTFLDSRFLTHDEILAKIAQVNKAMH